MEQIETQASDLRYLTAPVAALSDSASVSYETPHSRPQMSPGSALYGDNSALQAGDDASPAANKRKSVEDGPGGMKQTRSKRNRVSCAALWSDFVLGFTWCDAMRCDATRMLSCCRGRDGGRRRAEQSDEAEALIGEAFYV